MPVKPSDKEEEFFAREEYERKKAREVAKQQKMREEEKLKAKELHFMHCPKCGMELVEIDYKGIAVDKCTSCDGIWLDAGELEAVSKFEKGVFDKFYSVFKR